MYGGEPEFVAVSLLKWRGGMAHAADIRKDPDSSDNLPRELSAVLRALPDLYFLLNGERRFVQYSAGKGQDLYVPPEQFLGKRFDMVMPPHVVPGMTEAIDRAHANDEVTTFEYMLEIAGARQWFELKLSPFDDGYTVAIARNVTEARVAAEELRLREARIHEVEKLEALGRVAGSIAHDFNNLLTIISAACTLAEREVPDGHAARARLATASDALRSARQLTDHLLGFARRGPLDPETVDLDDIIDGMGFILRGLAPSPIQIVRHRSSSPPRVFATRVHIEQVVMNLVANAAQAMGEDGALTLTTDASADERSVRLEVGDTGSGMTPDVRERALQPFFTTKGASQGTGLGLATVDRIARSCGGSVDIASALGDGTRVTVWFPRATPGG